MKLDNTTIRGLIAVIGAIALVIRPDKIAEITAAVFSLSGTINIIRNPNPPPTP
jgi:hypothetical protein